MSNVHFYESIHEKSKDTLTEKEPNFKQQPIVFKALHFNIEQEDLNNKLTTKSIFELQ